MGFTYKNTNSAADYSNSGLGNANFRSAFYTNAGVSDLHQSAYETFYDNLIAANLWSKIYGITPFYGSTESSQKYKFDESNGIVDFLKIGTYSGFSSAGFRASDSGSFTENIIADTGYIIPSGEIDNLTVGVAFNSLESAGKDFLAGVWGTQGTTDNNVRLFMSKQFDISGNNLISGIYPINPSSGSESYDGYIAQPLAEPTRGMLQINRVDGSNSMILDDAIVGTEYPVAGADTPTGGSLSKLTIGGTIRTSDDLRIPNSAIISFAYYGALSNDEAIKMNGYVDALLVSLGR